MSGEEFTSFEELVSRLTELLQAQEDAKWEMGDLLLLGRAKFGGRGFARAVAAAGHEIGNHGSYHGHPTQLGRAELERMIEENAVLLKEVVGRPASRLFAPPYGEFDQRTVGIAAELGYRTVLWTVDTVDWKRPAPEVIAERVARKVKNGAIILMHPTAPTVAALPGIIKDLKARGFRLVTVGEMLR